MALLLVLGPWLLPEFRDPAAGRLDLGSAALSLAAVLAAIYGLKQLAQDGPGWLALGCMLAGLLVGAWAVATLARRGPSPCTAATLTIRSATAMWQVSAATWLQADAGGEASVRLAGPGVRGRGAVALQHGARLPAGQAHQVGLPTAFGQPLVGEGVARLVRVQAREPACSPRRRSICTRPQWWARQGLNP